MRGKPPIVQQYMTRLPIEAEHCQTVEEAIRIIESHDIRHIPVMSGSRLKGIVSHRDILQACVKHGSRLDDISLDEICEQDVLSVSPITRIDEVAKQMLERKVGSAVVVDGGFVVGIFTTTDALRVLSDLGKT